MVVWMGMGRRVVVVRSRELAADAPSAPPPAPSSAWRPRYPETIGSHTTSESRHAPFPPKPGLESITATQAERPPEGGPLLRTFRPQAALRGGRRAWAQQRAREMGCTTIGPARSPPPGAGRAASGSAAPSTFDTSCITERGRGKGGGEGGNR